MGRRAWAVGLAYLAALSVACKNTPVVFENPADPRASNYSPPIAPFSAQSGILVDDFDDANTQRNLLNYCPETFRDPGNVAILTVSHVGAGALRGTGQSLRIDFDVAGPGDPFGGYVQLLTGNDSCPSSDGVFNAGVLRLEFLSFWIKTSSSQVDVEVAIKDITDAQTYPKKLTRGFASPDTSWHKVRIPLTTELGQGVGRRVDLQRLREVNFGFAKRRFQDENLETRGTVFLDEIAFER